MTEDVYSNERQSLLNNLLEAVKQCQTRYGGRAELAYENDTRVDCLLKHLEKVFLHGFKKKNRLAFGKQMSEIMKSFHNKNQQELDFWDCIKFLLNKHDLERYTQLKNICSDVGRSRAWLRSTLNERSLEKYLNTLLADPALLRQYYETWAFVLDQERASMLPIMAAGLGSIVFALNINNADLNPPINPALIPVYVEPQPSLAGGPGKKRKKKRPSSQIIVFDEDEIKVPGHTSSAPATCVSSPVSGHQFPQSLGNPSDSEEAESFNKYNSIPKLVPIQNGSFVGDLFPLSQAEEVAVSEDSISIPSFGEDTENAAAALAMAQKAVNWRPPSDSCVTKSRTESDSLLQCDTLTMTPDELREALLAVLQRKEEAEEKNVSLRNLLDQEMERSAGLRAEMEGQNKYSTEKIEKLELKISALIRESDLLKHQLKKYISAVQLLKRDSSVHGHEGVLAEIEPAIPEPKSFVDHQFEASQYEQKLVQVAEMHGELMEFNDRLHRLLLQREMTIRRLRDELVDLRGPLPDGNQTSDDELSATSDYDNSSQTLALRPLINCWIPTAFLTGNSPNTHHVYQIFIRIRDEEWNIYRRYSQFYSLHKVLKKMDPIVNTFDFPPKKALGKKEPKLVEGRRLRFQHYLRSVINWLLQTSPELAANPEKENFISILPFFGEEHSRSTNRVPSTENHYMGL